MPVKKTTIQASIEIDSVAWQRVRDLATHEHGPLPMVIGDLQNRASSAPATEVPKAEEPYEPPPLVRLLLRRHPGAKRVED
jgi:hypothetical protein